MNLRKLLSNVSPSRYKGLVLGAAVAASSVLAVACASEKPKFTEGKTFAGGIQVDAATLNEGYESYMHYCYACHGEQGNGVGPSSYGLRPPPRDFTKGIFKFARLRTSDDLPNDDDLFRIVKGGLHGTAMLPWDIPEAELNRILQYVKTFAPQKWEKKKKSGEPVKTLEVWQPEADPWVGKVDQAIERGKALYHLKAECLNCHPSYETKEGLYNLSVKVTEEDAKKPDAQKDNFKVITGFREDPYGSVAKDSPEYGVKIIPPDFTFHPVRSVREGTETEDLYRVISFGVYPIMPAWKGAGLSDSDIWAIAYYVRSLVGMRGTPAADALKQKLAAQKAFQIPAPAPPPAAPEAAAAEGASGEEAAKEGEKKEGDAAAQGSDAAAPKESGASAKEAEGKKDATKKDATKKDAIKKVPGEDKNKESK
jgi:mono/diheme cytochrome c family protein